MDALRQKINYIHNNPVKAGYVDKSWHYPWSSAADYSGTPGILPVTIVDLGLKTY